MAPAVTNEIATKLPSRQGDVLLSAEKVLGIGPELEQLPSHQARVGCNLPHLSYLNGLKMGRCEHRGVIRNEAVTH